MLLFEARTIATDGPKVYSIGSLPKSKKLSRPFPVQPKVQDAFYKDQSVYAYEMFLRRFKITCLL